MHAVSPHDTPAVKRRGPPPQQSGDEGEQIRLADELSEREGIPIDQAYSIVSRHHSTSVMGHVMGSDLADLARRMPKFDLGECAITPGALVVLEFNGISPIELLHRHACGDWGDLELDDKAANEAALQTGDRILSAYQLAGEERVWIITYPGDNSVILLPEEY